MYIGVCLVKRSQALLGSNLMRDNQVRAGECSCCAWGRLAPSVLHVAAVILLSCHASKNSFVHAVDKTRHSPYVFPWETMCQKIVASFRMTATRAMPTPRRRLIRLYHSRNSRSLRNTLKTNWASSQRAMPLPALVIRPSRWPDSPLLRQPGVSPQ